MFADERSTFNVRRRKSVASCRGSQKGDTQLFLPRVQSSSILVVIWQYGVCFDALARKSRMSPFGCPFGCYVSTAAGSEKKNVVPSPTSIGPDSSSVPLDDPLADGQADARAGVFVRGHAAAGISVKMPVGLFGGNADPVVPDPQHPLVARPAWRRRGSPGPGPRDGTSPRCPGDSGRASPVASVGKEVGSGSTRHAAPLSEMAVPRLARALSRASWQETVAGLPAAGATRE